MAYPSAAQFGQAQRDAVVTSVARLASLDREVVGVADVTAGDDAGMVLFELQVFTDSVSRLDELAAAGEGSCPGCDKFEMLNAIVATTLNATLSASARVKTVNFACVSCGELVI